MKKIINQIDIKYRIIHKISESSNGFVYKIQEKNTGELLVMKLIKKSSIKLENYTNFQDELDLYINSPHDNIIRIYEYFIDDVNFIIITEFLNGNDLLSTITSIKLEKYSEDNVYFIINQLFKAVDYFHSKLNVFNCVLHPENIIVCINETKDSKDMKDLNDNKVFLTADNTKTDIKLDTKNETKNETKNDIIDMNKNVNKIQNKFQIKIINVGSRFYAKNNSYLYTSYYLSPELLIKKNIENINTNNNVNPSIIKMDEWVCGIILYLISFGNPPFYGNNNTEITNNIIKGELFLFSEQYKIINKLITDLLVVNVNNRIAIKDALNSAWLINMKKNISEGILSTKYGLKVQENLNSFNSKEKFIKAIVDYIEIYKCSQETVQKLYSIFEKNKGRNITNLSYNELRFGFEFNFGPSIADFELEKIHILLDKDKDKNGNIDFKVFLTYYFKCSQEFSKEKLRLSIKNLEIKNDKNDNKFLISDILAILNLNNNSTLSQFISSLNSLMKEQIIITNEELFGLLFKTYKLGINY